VRKGNEDAQIRIDHVCVCVCKCKSMLGVLKGSYYAPFYKM